MYYRETIEAMGFVQCNKFATHKLGHNLDHVLVDMGGNIKVSKCKTGPFISDHCMVIFNVTVQREY